MQFESSEFIFGLFLITKRQNVKKVNQSILQSISLEKA